MREVEFNHLSNKIQALLQSHQTLRTENDSLRAELTKAQQEYDALKVKNQQAAEKIRNIITQLRTQAL